MGVSGSGKSTVGAALAARLGWAFVDADDHHLPANRDKLARGIALTDEDREPWLLALRGVLETHARQGRPVVLACSGLRASHRELLCGGLERVRLVFLDGSRERIAERMRGREHFMPVSLLDSQLATLEPPEGALRLDIEEPVPVLVERAVRGLGLG